MSLNGTGLFFPRTEVSDALGANETTILIEKPTIPDEIMAALRIYIALVLKGIVAVIGVCTNSINMIIFSRLGLKDSMSVGLMALSISDFLVTFLGVAASSCFIVDALFRSVSFNPVVFQSVAFGWYGDSIYLISGWITTILSAERCICVVWPFRVKDIFTRTRTIISIVIVCVVHFAVYMPIFISQKIVWIDVNVTTGNKTVLVRDKMKVEFWDNRDDLQVYMDIANGAVLPIPSQAIVLISVIWMIYGLHASSQVRKSATEENAGVKKSNLSSKESRLVKVVLSLSIMLTFCNIPRFVAVYAKQLFPDVYVGKRDANVYFLLWYIASVATFTNTSINIIVYLSVNSNYRQEFKKLFYWSKNTKE